MIQSIASQQEDSHSKIAKSLLVIQMSQLHITVTQLFLSWVNTAYQMVELTSQDKTFLNTQPSPVISDLEAL